ncbi:MAG TPA: hypothetical protein VII45_02205 [Solirubrobacterales bacterium]
MITPPRLRLPVVALGLVASLLVALLTATSSGAAQPTYEPNDTLTTAFGPLAPGKYSAVTETTNDKDYFYFYVTAPSTAQATFTLRDFGGGTSPYGETEALVENSHGYGVGEGDEIGAEVNNYGTSSVTLGPGKYYVEVFPEDAYGDSYTLELSGTTGAFTEYAPIAAQCAVATASVTAAQGVVAIDQGKVKKATAWVKRAERKRHPRTIRVAKGSLKRAKAELAGANEGYKAATAGQKPWCEIPA